jgi:hypothetical protein
MSWGMPWVCRACWAALCGCPDCVDVREQLAILDGYVFNRLKRLQVSVLGSGGAKLGPAYDFSNFDMRAEGLMTFKDVANRFPAGSDSAKRSGPVSQLT